MQRYFICLVMILLCLPVFSQQNTEDRFADVLEKFGIVNSETATDIKSEGGYRLTRDTANAGEDVKVHFFNFSIDADSGYSKLAYPFSTENYKELAYANATVRIGGQTFSDPESHLVTIQADQSECYVQNANHVRVYVNLMLVYVPYK